MESGSAEKVKDGSPGRKPVVKPQWKAHVCDPVEANAAPRPAKAPAASAPASVVIRAFPLKQIDQLMKLYAQTYWANRRRKIDVLRMLKHTPLTVSAWDGRRLVGFCRVLTDFMYRAALYDVVVDADYRGRGVGRRLLEAVTGHPRLRRVERWFLTTRDQHGFYERLGWRRCEGNFMELRREAGAERRAMNEQR